MGAQGNVEASLKYLEEVETLKKTKGQAEVGYLLTYLGIKIIKICSFVFPYPFSVTIHQKKKSVKFDFIHKIKYKNMLSKIFGYFIKTLLWQSFYMAKNSNNIYQDW